ncbi:MAG: ATP-binding protein [Thermoplasmata archaeon]|nr:ATP-binding protein [Thermoplasmata archaeon]
MGSNDLAPSSPGNPSLEAAFDSFPDGVLLTNSARRLVYANPRAAEILSRLLPPGSDVHQALGPDLFESDGVTPLDLEELLIGPALLGKPGHSLDAFLRAGSAGGGLELVVACRGIRDTENRCVGVVLTLHEATRRGRTEFELRLVDHLESLLSRSADDPSPFQGLVEELNRAAGWTLTEMWVPDSKGQGLRPVASAASTANSPEVAAAREAWKASARTRRLPFDDPVVGRAWSQRELVVERELEARGAPPWDTDARRLGVQGVVAIPLQTSRGPAAVILVGVSDARGMDDRFISLTRRLGSAGDRFAERRLLASQQRAAAEAERQAIAAKTGFFANMSHELRTPLNAIIGLAEILTENLTLEERREYARIIRTGALGLLSLINDILDMSRIESGKLELEQRPVDVVATVEEAIDLVAATANQKGLELTFTVAGDVPTGIVGDSQRLRQILLNLLSNAVKFTEKGEVSVRLTPRHPEAGPPLIEFAIHDTGPGIPEEVRGRLFQNYSQADASTSRRFGGSGLGLAISRSLTELMGGTIWVEESPAGSGATFHFTVLARLARVEDTTYPRGKISWLEGKPVLILLHNATLAGMLASWGEEWGAVVQRSTTEAGASALLSGGIPAVLVHDLDREPAALLNAVRRAMPSASSQFPVIRIVRGPGGLGPLEDPPRNVRRIVLRRPLKPRGFLSALERALSVEPVARVAEIPVSVEEKETAQEHPLRILVVEDNPINQQVVDLILRRLGYRGDFVDTGRAAVDAVRRSAYDVILMDIELPDIDGVTATEQIRVLPGSTPRDPWIIAATAHGSGPEVDRINASSMNGFLPKPIRLEALRTALSVSPKFRDRAAPTPPSGLGSPRATSTSSAVTRLEELRAMRTGPDRQFVISLLETFFREADQWFPALQRALADRDAQALRQAAHRLKGGALEVGAIELAGFCQELEEAGQSGNLDLASHRLKGARDAYKRIRPMLDRMAAGTPPAGR